MGGLNMLGAISPEITPAAKVAAGGVSLAGLGATIYLVVNGRWGWALANFFLLTPLASIATANVVNSATGGK